MLPLLVGEEVHIQVMGSSVIYSDTEYQTSFSGFYYNPTHNAPVSFAVARDSSIGGLTSHDHILIIFIM